MQQAMPPRCPHFLPGNRKVRRPYLDSHIFHIPHQPDDPPYTPAAFHKFTKIRKVHNLTSRRPYTAAHASQIPTRLGSPYGPCSHMFPRIPHTTLQLQKIRFQFRRDQRSGAANPAPIQPRIFPGPAYPVSTHPQHANPRPLLHGHGARTPAETSAAGLRKPTHSTNSLKFPAPTRGAWATTLRRRCDVDDRGGSTCMCDRAIGPKGPITVKP